MADGDISQLGFEVTTANAVAEINNFIGKIKEIGDAVDAVNDKTINIDFDNNLLKGALANVKQNAKGLQDAMSEISTGSGSGTKGKAKTKKTQKINIESGSAPDFSKTEASANRAVSSIESLSIEVIGAKNQIEDIATSIEAMFNGIKTTLNNNSGLQEWVDNNKTQLQKLQTTISDTVNSVKNLLSNHGKNDSTLNSLERYYLMLQKIQEQATEIDKKNAGKVSPFLAELVDIMAKGETTKNEEIAKNTPPHKRIGINKTFSPSHIAQPEEVQKVINGYQLLYNKTTALFDNLSEQSGIKAPEVLSDLDEKIKELKEFKKLLKDLHSDTTERTETARAGIIQEQFYAQKWNYGIQIQEALQNIPVQKNDDVLNSLFNGKKEQEDIAAALSGKDAILSHVKFNELKFKNEKVNEENGSAIPAQNFVSPPENAPAPIAQPISVETQANLIITGIDNISFSGAKENNNGSKSSFADLVKDKISQGNALGNIPLNTNADVFITNINKFYFGEEDSAKDLTGDVLNEEIKKKISTLTIPSVPVPVDLNCVVKNNDIPISFGKGDKTETVASFVANAVKNATKNLKKVPIKVTGQVHLLDIDKSIKEGETEDDINKDIFIDDISYRLNSFIDKSVPIEVIADVYMTGIKDIYYGNKESKQKFSGALLANDIKKNLQSEENAAGNAIDLELPLNLTLNSRGKVKSINDIKLAIQSSFSDASAVDGVAEPIEKGYTDAFNEAAQKIEAAQQRALNKIATSTANGLEAYITKVEESSKSAKAKINSKIGGLLDDLDANSSMKEGLGFVKDIIRTLSKAPENFERVSGALNNLLGELNVFVQQSDGFSSAIRDIKQLNDIAEIKPPKLSDFSPEALDKWIASAISALEQKMSSKPVPVGVTFDGNTQPFADAISNANFSNIPIGGGSLDIENNWEVKFKDFKGFVKNISNKINESLKSEESEPITIESKANILITDVKNAYFGKDSKTKLSAVDFSTYIHSLIEKSNADTTVTITSPLDIYISKIANVFTGEKGNGKPLSANFIWAGLIKYIKEKIGSNNLNLSKPLDVNITKMQFYAGNGDSKKDFSLDSIKDVLLQKLQNSGTSLDIPIAPKIIVTTTADNIELSDATTKAIAQKTQGTGGKPVESLSGEDISAKNKQEERKIDTSIAIAEKSLSKEERERLRSLSDGNSINREAHSWLRRPVPIGVSRVEKEELYSEEDAKARDNITLENTQREILDGFGKILESFRSVLEKEQGAEQGNLARAIKEDPFFINLSKQIEDWESPKEFSGNLEEQKLAKINASAVEKLIKAYKQFEKTLTEVIKKVDETEQSFSDVNEAVKKHQNKLRDRRYQYVLGGIAQAENAVNIAKKGDGQPLRSQEHFDRLAQAARAIGMDVAPYKKDEDGNATKKPENFRQEKLDYDLSEKIKKRHDDQLAEIEEGLKGSFENKIRLDIEGLYTNPLKKLQIALHDTGNAYVSFLNTMGLAVSAQGVFNWFTSATRAASKFNIEIRRIQSLATDMDFSELRKGLLSINPIYGNVLSNAKALYWAYSSGVRGTAADLVNFTEEMAKTARAINSDVMSTTDAITNIMNAYEYTVADAERLGNTLFMIVKEGKANAQQLTASLGNAISTLSSLGIKENEWGAAIGTLSRTMSANKAMTVLNNIISKMINPSNDVADLMQELGLELSANSIRAKGFAQTMLELRNATQGNIGMIARLFPDLRGQRAAVTLLSSQWNEFARQLGVFSDVSGTRDEGLKSLVDTPEAAVESLKNLTAAIKIETGNALINVATLGGVITPLIQKINELGSVGKGLLGWAATIAGLGFGLNFISKALTLLEYNTANATIQKNMLAIDVQQNTLLAQRSALQNKYLTEQERTIAIQKQAAELQNSADLREIDTKLKLAQIIKETHQQALKQTQIEDKARESALQQYKRYIFGNLAESRTPLDEASYALAQVQMQNTEQSNEESKHNAFVTAINGVIEKNKTTISFGRENLQIIDNPQHASMLDIASADIAQQVAKDFITDDGEIDWEVYNEAIGKHMENLARYHDEEKKQYQQAIEVATFENAVLQALRDAAQTRYEQSIALGETPNAIATESIAKQLSARRTQRLAIYQSENSILRGVMESINSYYSSPGEKDSAPGAGLENSTAQIVRLEQLLQASKDLTDLKQKKLLLELQKNIPALEQAANQNSQLTKELKNKLDAFDNDIANIQKNAEVRISNAYMSGGIRAAEIERNKISQEINSKVQEANKLLKKLESNTKRNPLAQNTGYLSAVGKMSGFNLDHLSNLPGIGVALNAIAVASVPAKLALSATSLGIAHLAKDSTQFGKEISDAGGSINAAFSQIGTAGLMSAKNLFTASRYLFAVQKATAAGQAASSVAVPANIASMSAASGMSAAAIGSLATTILATTAVAGIAAAIAYGAWAMFDEDGGLLGPWVQKQRWLNPITGMADARDKTTKADLDIARYESRKNSEAISISDSLITSLSSQLLVEEERLKYSKDNNQEIKKQIELLRQQTSALTNAKAFMNKSDVLLAPEENKELQKMEELKSLFPTGISRIFANSNLLVDDFIDFENNYKDFIIQHFGEEIWEKLKLWHSIEPDTNGKIVVRGLKRKKVDNKIAELEAKMRSGADKERIKAIQDIYFTEMSELDKDVKTRLSLVAMDDITKQEKLNQTQLESNKQQRIKLLNIDNIQYATASDAIQRLVKKQGNAKTALDNKKYELGGKDPGDLSQKERDELNKLENEYNKTTQALENFRMKVADLNNQHVELIKTQIALNKQIKELAQDAKITQMSYKSIMTGRSPENTEHAILVEQYNYAKEEHSGKIAEIRQRGVQLAEADLKSSYENLNKYLETNFKPEGENAQEMRDLKKKILASTTTDEDYFTSIQKLKELYNNKNFNSYVEAIGKSKDGVKEATKVKDEDIKKTKEWIESLKNLINATQNVTESAASFTDYLTKTIDAVASEREKMQRDALLPSDSYGNLRKYKPKAEYREDAFGYLYGKRDSQGKLIEKPGTIDRLNIDAVRKMYGVDFSSYITEDGNINREQMAKDMLSKNAQKKKRGQLALKALDMVTGTPEQRFAYANMLNKKMWSNNGYDYDHNVGYVYDQLREDKERERIMRRGTQAERTGLYVHDIQEERAKLEKQYAEAKKAAEEAAKPGKDGKIDQAAVQENLEKMRVIQEQINVGYNDEINAKIRLNEVQKQNAIETQNLAKQLNAMSQASVNAYKANSMEAERLRLRAFVKPVEFPDMPKQSDIASIREEAGKKTVDMGNDAVRIAQEAKIQQKNNLKDDLKETKLFNDSCVRFDEAVNKIRTVVGREIAL